MITEHSPEGNAHILSPHLAFGQIPEGIASLAQEKHLTYKTFELPTLQPGLENHI
jgi:hypothetical protein